MKQLLVVSWCMPPLLFPRSIQVARTLKYLAPLGWQATVVAVDPRSVARSSVRDPTLEALYAKELRVVRVGSPEEALPLRVVRHFVPVLGRLPDTQRVWMRRAVRAAQAVLSAADFSALISFAQPWSDHLIGFRLHRSSGLPWIAHFSDPWVDSPYLQGGRWLREQCRRMEEMVIREADAVVFVSSPTADLVMRKYPASWKNKVHVIPHGYDPELMRSRTDAPPGDDRLRLVYTGNFYSLRGPSVLLEALAVLNRTMPLELRLQVTFVGFAAKTYAEAAERLGVGGFVEFLGPRSYTDSLAAAAAADVLLLIDAPSQGASVFLPSKLIDYLMFKKPILGITPLAGASADLLRGLGCPVVAPDDVAGIARVIDELAGQRRSGRLTVGRSYDEVAAQYDCRRTAQTLHALLERCVTRGATHAADTDAPAERYVSGALP